MSALLIFPLSAIIWMVISAKLGLVEDQPMMEEDVEPMALQPTNSQADYGRFEVIEAR